MAPKRTVGECEKRPGVDPGLLLWAKKCAQYPSSVPLRPDLQRYHPNTKIYGICSVSRRLKNGHQEGLEGDRLAIDTEAGSATSTQGLANKQTSLPKIARYPDSEVGIPQSGKVRGGDARDHQPPTFSGVGLDATCKCMRGQSHAMTMQYICNAMRIRKSSRKGDRCQLILGWCGTTILLG